ANWRMIGPVCRGSGGCGLTVLEPGGPRGLPCSPASEDVELISSRILLISLGASLIGWKASLISLRVLLISQGTLLISRKVSLISLSVLLISMGVLLVSKGALLISWR